MPSSGTGEPQRFARARIDSTVGSVAIANDESGTLAMLRKLPGESFAKLLARLDQAIEYALESEEMIDEVNRR